MTVGVVGQSRQSQKSSKRHEKGRRLDSSTRKKGQSMNTRNPRLQISVGHPFKVWGSIRKRPLVLPTLLIAAAVIICTTARTSAQEESPNLAWLKANRAAWPKTVEVTIETPITLRLDGKPVGTMKLPPGSKVVLLEIKEASVTVRLATGDTEVVPASATNIETLAAERRNSAMSQKVEDTDSPETAEPTPQAAAENMATQGPSTSPAGDEAKITPNANAQAASRLLDKAVISWDFSKAKITPTKVNVPRTEGFQLAPAPGAPESRFEDWAKMESQDGTSEGRYLALSGGPAQGFRAVDEHEWEDGQPIRVEAEVKLGTMPKKNVIIFRLAGFDLGYRAKEKAIEFVIHHQEGHLSIAVPAAENEWHNVVAQYQDGLLELTVNGETTRGEVPEGTRMTAMTERFIFAIPRQGESFQGGIRSVAVFTDGSRPKNR